MPSEPFDHMKPILSDEEREALTDVQRAERRTRAILARNKDVIAQQLKSRNSRLMRIFRNWFSGEINALRIEDVCGGGTFQTTRAWVREQLKEVIVETMKGGEGLEVEKIIREQVGNAIRGISGSAINSKAGQAKFVEYINAIVADEVRKQVMASLVFDIGVKGRVFTPPKGARRVDIGMEDED